MRVLKITVAVTAAFLLVLTLRVHGQAGQRDYLVWATYYTGQCCIALGFMQERLERD